MSRVVHATNILRDEIKRLEAVIEARSAELRDYEEKCHDLKKLIANRQEWLDQARHALALLDSY